MEDDLNIFPKMEDDLNCFKNGRQLHFFSKMEDDLNLLKETRIWKYEQNSLLSKTKVKQGLYTAQVMCITFVLTSQWIYG